MGEIAKMAKAICIVVVVLSIVSLIGLLFGSTDNANNSTNNSQPIVTPTQTKSFYPHGMYAEAYIPSITEIGDGKDWYMTKKETQVEGLLCTATYIKDEHRTVVITISICPTVNGAKTIYDERLADAPYVE